MIAVKQIAWLAGLLEGEGSFTRNRNNISIRLSMTDADVVHAVAKLLDTPVTVSRTNREKNPKWGVVYACSLHGNRAAAWMMTLYSLMGARRQSRIKTVLQEWKTSQVVRRSPRLLAHYECGA